MPDSAAAARQRIRALLLELCGDTGLVRDMSDTVSLRQAGVSSNALVSLLVAMEDEFGFEWDDDVQPEVLRSIGSLAEYVVTLRP